MLCINFNLFVYIYISIECSNLLLEVLCLEVQLCSVTSNSARLKELYPKTLNLTAAITDPRTMGIIREEGGKMYMSEGLWDEAYNEFYQSFRCYQEAGNSRAKDCLKYVVLASMLVRRVYRCLACLYS